MEKVVGEVEELEVGEGLDDVPNHVPVRQKIVSQVQLLNVRAPTKLRFFVKIKVIKYKQSGLFIIKHKSSITHL